MDVTQGMPAVEFKIWFPVIMAEDSLEMRQYAYFFHSLQSSFFVGMVMAPQTIGYTMKPDPFPIDIDAGLVRMAQAGFDQPGFQHRFKGFQFVTGIIVKIENCPGTDRNLYLILKVFFNSLIKAPVDIGTYTQNAPSRLCHIVPDG